MRRSLTRTGLFAVLLAVATGLPVRALACATCYGASDSPLADGMNWGIFTLLAFIGCVLATLVVFFVYLARRAARFHAAEPSQLQTDPIA